MNITILGCGVTGMLIALRLAHEGISTTILERSDMKWQGDRRTIALTGFSKNILRKIDLWPNLEPYVGEIKDVYVVDNKSPQMLHLLRDSGAAGYMIENSHLKDAIFKAVQQEPLITLLTKAEPGDPSEYDLMILCDGKGSPLRQKYFIDRVSKNYDQSAMTFLVRHAKAHEGTAVEHFMPQGPFASLPMRDPHESGIVWTEKTEVAKLYMQMDRSEYAHHLRERFGDFLGELEIISEPQAFPLSARVVNNYYHENMVVVGDSAHTIHPLAGQGLNQGIKDIDVLGEIIARNLSVGLPVDAMALKEYENKRRMDNYRMYLVTDNLNRLFSNNLPIWRDVRKAGLALLDKLPLLKGKLVGYTGS